jgi:hypothetical protein
VKTEDRRRGEERQRRPRLDCSVERDDVGEEERNGA